MDSGTLGGTMKGVARGAVGPSVREGRVATIGSPSLVAIRSVMGDTKPLPVRGLTAYADAARGDAVWVAEDEGGALVVVAWESA